MENKFTIGSQWITKGGWRAVVVDIDVDCVKVWHKHGNYTVYHNVDGTTTKEPEMSLEKPYTEPRKGTVWVCIWNNITDNYTFAKASDNYEEYKEDIDDTEGFKLIASFKHDWTENDKI